MAEYAEATDRTAQRADRHLRNWVIGIAGMGTFIILGLLFSGSGPSWDNLAAQAYYFEVRRLFFAAGVLIVLSFLLVLGIACLVWGPPATDNGEAPGRVVFDSLIKIIPPIMTLVLGFYFGQSTQKPPETRPTPPTLPAGAAASGPASAPLKTGAASREVDYTLRWTLTV
jgi:hypothetical protein